MADRSDAENDDYTGGETDDPQVIRSVAVTVDDVIAALEANRSADRGAVLRITPPFAGRMRARIHVAGGEGTYDGEAEPIHLDPDSLVGNVPDYPTADETASQDSADNIETRRQRHTERVEAWREAVRGRLKSNISLATESGSVDVRLLSLG